MPTREDVEMWICQDVAHYLVQQGLQDCADIAERFNIDGARFLALSYMDLHKFPLNCQPQIFKLSQNINKLDPKGKWKVMAELTKRFQVNPTDMWQTGKEKMTRLVKTEPPAPPPPDYKQGEPYKSEAWIYDDCITQAGRQTYKTEGNARHSSSDSDEMDYIIPNGASANPINISPARGSQNTQKPKPVERIDTFDYENEGDFSPTNTVATSRGVLKAARTILIPRGDSTSSRAETPPSPAPRPSFLQTSLSTCSSGPGLLKKTNQGEKDLHMETPGKGKTELRSRRCFKSNSETQSSHGQGQLAQLPVAPSSRPLPDTPGAAQPRAFIPLPLPPLSNLSVGFRPALGSGSDVAKGVPRSFTSPKLTATTASGPMAYSSCSRDDLGMGRRKSSPTTLPWPTAANSASSSADDLQTKKWYAGKCDNHLAKKVVKSYNKDGAFLVRQSSRDRVVQPYTLVVYYRGIAYSLRLYRDPVSKRFYLSKEQCFTTVVHLVEHYQQNPLYLKTESSSATQLATTHLRYPVSM